MYKFLVIQTAFTGDVILATALVEKLHICFPDAKIDFMLRKGNESLLAGHPFIGTTYVWDKKQGKLKNLFKIALEIRKQHYTHIINPHRFFTSGLVCALSGAKFVSGFDKNPLSFLFSTVVKHQFSESEKAPLHEVTRNQALIANLTDDSAAAPRLYPTPGDYKQAEKHKEGKYICIAPASVWFTKRFPADQWASLIDRLPAEYKVYLLGGKPDRPLGDEIISLTTSKRAVNLCGELNFLPSAALMRGAAMNYANDSAPLHIASAMGAPVTAVFCSTTTRFGFGPINENGVVVETLAKLSCRPCGIHGHKACPEGHFKCAKNITDNQLLWWISNQTSKTV